MYCVSCWYVLILYNKNNLLHISPLSLPFSPLSHTLTILTIPLGSYAGSLGSQSCQLCNPGYYTNQLGTYKCTACPVGNYCPGQGTVNPVSCVPGSYSLDPGNDHCQLCNAGYYSNQPATIKCTACPAGSYCPNPGTVSPINCPSGFYCKQSATQPSQCNTLYHSSSHGDVCTYGGGRIERGGRREGEREWRVRGECINTPNLYHLEVQPEPEFLPHHLRKCARGRGGRSHCMAHTYQ